MADKSEVFGQLLQRFYDSLNTGEVLKVIKQLEDLQQSGDLSARERYELQAQGFRTLKRLTSETPDRAENLILEYLLPQCLVDDPEARLELSQHRECLVDWLDQYSEVVRHDLRDNVLERLYPRLGSSETVTACWLISQLGYRSEEAEKALQDIIKQNDDDIGDTALATLTSLGVSPSQRESLLSQLHDRVTSRYNYSLVSALMQLADPTSIEIVYDLWLMSDERKLRTVDRSLIFNVFRSILDANSDDSDLQDRVWKRLASLAEERPDEFAHEFHLADTAPRCNSVLVAPTMLEWLGRENVRRDDPAWGRYLVGLRLDECVRPRQLEGWKGVDNTPAFESLRQDACLDTGSDGFSTTKGSMIKKKAWETILRAGYTDALDWFNEAVLPEKSRFLQQKIIEWFALFRFRSLPEVIIQWVTEDYDMTSSGRDSREFMRRMAATRMARSSASREAFNVLSNFGLTYEGKAMMQSVYALTEVALHLISEGDTRAIDELVEAAVDRAQEHQRVAAVYALDHIALRFPSLLLKHAEYLIPAIYDTEREHYERGTLISILGQLQGWQIPAKLLQDLKDWARKPDGWIQDSSLEVLVRHDYLHKCHDLLEEVLRLQWRENGWDLVPNVERFKGAPHIIGLLYHSHLDAFTPAIASLVQTLDWLSVPQILDMLRYTHGKPDQPMLPKVVEDMLVQRANKMQSIASSETEVFRVLTELAPTRLARERWEDEWMKWHPDSRVALADALGEAELESAAHDRAVSMLRSLIGDGQFAVRRAAYRGLARQSMSALHRLCLSWSISLNMQTRQRAAEACGWLGQAADEDDSDGAEKLYQALVADREKSVREAAERTWKERRRRLWAKQYLTIIMNVRGQTNEGILDAWRYGEALARVGDDSCLRVLRMRLENGEALWPNVRYWVQQILEKAEENWRKTTQEWPEPWFTWDGATAEAKGSVRIPHGRWHKVKCSIWSQPGTALSEKHSIDRWGGAIWPIPMSVAFELQGRDDRMMELELEDGWQGSIFVDQITKGTAYFTGKDPSPSLFS